VYAATTVGVFSPVDNSGQAESNPGAIVPIVQSAIDASDIGDFEAGLISTPVVDPAVPPLPAEAEGTNFSLTSEILYDAAGSEMQLYFYLYDNSTERLVVSDQMVYQTVDEATEFIPFMIDFFLSRIEPPPETPPAEEPPPEEPPPEEPPPEEPPPEEPPAEEPSPEEPPPEAPPEEKRYFSLGLNYNLFILFGPGEPNGGHFDNTLMPLGASLDFAWMPIQKDWGTLGFGFEGTFNYLQKERSYTATASHVSLELNAFYEPSFFEGFLLPRFGIGFGGDLQTDTYITYADGAQGKWVNPAPINFLVSIFADLNIHLRNRLYLNAGLKGGIRLGDAVNALLSFNLGINFRF
jgi:hypothetical protein